ncbi:MAG: hypothetical protein SWY16_22145 [Cyanobacteriota bacterium]|nr:hypothetical protein [Cyanobacteriota bacterium]
MLDDTEFAETVRGLARDIQVVKIQDNSSMQQTVIGDNNTNIQAEAEQGGTNYNAQNITVNNHPSQP